MYLDHDTIASILNKIGITKYQLFLSSEIGYTKQTGNLFDYIISFLDISSSDLIHIGDNKKSDYENSMKKGIRAIWLREQKKLLRYWNKSQDKSINVDHLYAVLKNKDFLAEAIENKFGYRLLGPILFNFCKWLDLEDKINNFDKIIFVAREGYLLYFVYRALFPYNKDKMLYLKINKNLLRLPVLYFNNSIDIFLNLIPKKKEYYILDIVQYFYMDDNSKKVRDLLMKYQYSFDSVVKRGEILSNDNFIGFYKECIKIQRDEMKRQYEFLLRYFAENNLNGKVALVNNSINANVQFYLQQVKENSSLDMEFWGIHFIISKKGIKKIKRHCSVWFDNQCCQFEKRLFYRNCLVFEHLLFESQGTALYYDEENGKIIAVCKKHEFELENDKVIEKIKSGVMEFIDDYVVRMPLCTKPSHNLDALCRFYLKPAIEDARMICNIKDDDFEESDLFHRWIQGKKILSNNSVTFYNLKLHVELIKKNLF